MKKIIFLLSLLIPLSLCMKKAVGLPGKSIGEFYPLSNPINDNGYGPINSEQNPTLNEQVSVQETHSLSGSATAETYSSSVDVDGDLNLNHDEKLEINGDLNDHSTSTTRISKGTHIIVHGNSHLGGKMEVVALKAGERIHFLDSTGPIKGAYESITIEGHPELRGRLYVIGDPEGYIMAAPVSYTL